MCNENHIWGKELVNNKKEIINGRGDRKEIEKTTERITRESSKLINSRRVDVVERLRNSSIFLSFVSISSSLFSEFYFFDWLNLNHSNSLSIADRVCVDDVWFVGRIWKVRFDKCFRLKAKISRELLWKAKSISWFLQSKPTNPKHHAQSPVQIIHPSLYATSRNSISESWRQTQQKSSMEDGQLTLHNNTFTLGSEKLSSISDFNSSFLPRTSEPQQSELASQPSRVMLCTRLAIMPLMRASRGIHSGSQSKWRSSTMERNGSANALSTWPCQFKTMGSSLLRESST